MKKFLSILFTVLVILSFTTTSVLAAGTESKKVTLVSVGYQQGGIILIFETSGLTKADLKDRSFYADSNYQKITCNFVDDSDRVRCIVAKKLAGRGAFLVTLAGFGFWSELPQSTECGGGEVPWISITIDFHDEYVNDALPRWAWDWYVDIGILEAWNEMGITYEINGTFCAPDWTPETEPQ